MLTLFHSLNARIKRRQRLALVESGDGVSLLSGLMAFTRRGDTRKGHAAQEESGGSKLEGASSTCRHTGGQKVAPRTLLAEPRAADNEEKWATSSIKPPSNDHTTVSAAATTATLASATEIGGGTSAP